MTLSPEKLKAVRSKVRRGELYLTVAEWLTVMTALDYTISAQSPGHTDLMVLPEDITKFLDENPPSDR